MNWAILSAAITRLRSGGLRRRDQAQSGMTGLSPLRIAFGSGDAFFEAIDCHGKMQGGHGLAVRIKLTQSKGQAIVDFVERPC